jgi:hypothetical protein
MVASSCAISILNMEAVSSPRNFSEFVQDYTAQIMNDYTASHYRTSNFHKKKMSRESRTSQHFPLGVNAGTFLSWAVICRPVSAL